MTLTWILIALGVALFLFLLVKFKHHHHHMSTGFMIIGLVIVLVFGYMTYTYFKDPVAFKEMSSSAHTYLVWGTAVAKNIGKITGFAIHQNWSMNSIQPLNATVR